LLPDRRRDGPENSGRRPGARYPDPRRRDLLPPAARTALAATHGEFGRFGDRAQTPGARAGRTAVVLPTLQPQTVRGVFRIAQHRAGFPAGNRAVPTVGGFAH